ncbi:MAG: response regulator transcription factor [Betaproteobacteria bacterium]|nr:MAG: response regulator transcription factor [Betaproteobacteria bacterium]
MRRKRRARSRSRATARIDCAQRSGRVVLRERRWYVGETALRILIVDDEAPARRRLRELLDDCMCALPLSIVGEAQHGREALDLLQSAPAELVLTDIHMPDMDGIELARHLLKLPNPPVVIFTTAFHEHAVQAFEVNAVDYLVKPVRVQRLLSALQKVPRLKPFTADKLAHLPASARRFLSVTERSRVVLVPIEDVIYLKAELKYITIRTREREFLLEESLTKLENEFGARFIRVHRNCIVAREHVRGFERRVGNDGDAHWEVLLNGVPETLPVSRRQQFIVRDIGRESITGAAA